MTWLGTRKGNKGVMEMFSQRLLDNGLFSVALSLGAATLGALHIRRHRNASALALIVMIAVVTLQSPRLFADDGSTRQQISSVEQTFTTHPSQLTITGTGFGTVRPMVTLGGVPLLVLLYTDTKVVVQLPTSIDSNPGTYYLKLTKSGHSEDDGNSTATFDTAIGAAGPTGPAGPQGAQGPTGAPGAMGATGATGNTGATGATGNTGAMGTPGPMGPAGATGTQGPAGAMGMQGLTGTAGATGPQGNAGATGPMGATGAQGATGAPGQPGSMGATGATGSVGPMGLMGATGATGAAGASNVYFTSKQTAAIPSGGGNVTIASLSLPAGSYLVSGKVLPSERLSYFISCSLSGDSGDVSTSVEGDFNIVLQGAVTLTSANTVGISCGTNNPGGAAVHYIALSAIQTGNLIVQ
jgi:hypothetical protein